MQIKLSGACGLASALTCALVTVTTTVLHMSRLQSLRECEYTKKTRTCTCYPLESSSLPTDSDGSMTVDESKCFFFCLEDDFAFTCYIHTNKIVVCYVLFSG